MNLPRSRSLFAPVAVLVLAVSWASLYANASFGATDRADFRFFPPFRASCDRNMNDHLGAEYYEIAKSVYAGKGFANPFRYAHDTGPTAWMPPVLPYALAGLLWATGGDEVEVMNAFIVLQCAALVVAGVLALLLARRIGLNPWAVLGVFLWLLVSHFGIVFQQTHDFGAVLVALTAVVAVVAKGNPLCSVPRAVAWGLAGGFVALVSPVVGFVWGVLTLVEAARGRTLGRLVVCGLATAVALTPWTIRNYQTFGKLIPVKSNLSYELYQAQCLEPDGLMSLPQLLKNHPFHERGRRDADYARLGEVAYLAEKSAAFRSAVAADPREFGKRVLARLLAATLVYAPFDARGEHEWYWGLWLSRLTHPLAFLSAVLLLATARRHGLRREQWVALVAYAAYLLPYAVVGYYDRYAFPLVALNALLIASAARRLADLTTTAAAEEPPPATAACGPPLHRWVLSLVACGGLWGYYQADFFTRLNGPHYTPFGGKVFVPDFFQEWYAARLWHEGRPVYTNLRAGDAHLKVPRDAHYLEWNAHPPGALLLALPFGALEFHSALPVWNMVSLWALVTAGIIIVVQLRLRVPGWAIVPLATAVLLTNPFWSQQTNAQLNAVLLLLFTGAWAADRSNRPALAGSLVGVAAVVKIFPAYLLLYFVLRREWRALAAGVLTIAGGVLVSSAVLGWDVWAVYATEMVPHTKEFATQWGNSSLTGFWLKLFDPAMQSFLFHPWPIVSSRGTATALALLTAVALSILLWRRSRHVDANALFAATVTAALLLSPVTWDHYFVMLLLPVAVAWERGVRRGLLCVAVGLLALNPYPLAEVGMQIVGVSPDWSKGGWESPPWLTATVLSVHTHALIVVFALLLTRPQTKPLTPGVVS